MSKKRLNGLMLIQFNLIKILSILIYILHVRCTKIHDSCFAVQIFIVYNLFQN